MGFHILTESGPLTLKAGERAKVAFTVTNGLGSDVEALLRVRAPDANQAWFTIAGGERRRFGPDATQNITIELHPPNNAAGGAFPFALIVADEKQPEEEWQHGPELTLTVTPGDPAPKSRLWLWLLIAGAAALLLIGVGLALCFTVGPCASGPGLGEACAVDEPRCDGDTLECTPLDMCLLKLGATGCKTGATDCSTGFCKDAACVAPPAIGEPCVEGNCAADDLLVCPESTCLGDVGAAGCTDDKQCLSGWCRKTETPARCAALLAPGEPCTEDRCQDARCLSGHCRAPDGAACTHDNQCESEGCVNDQCRRLPGVGQACLAGRCEKSLACPIDRCLVPLGGSCTSAPQCVTGNCTGGRCQDIPGVGQPCNGPCDGTLKCVNHVCKMPEGGTCGRASDCELGYCDGGVCKKRVAVGAACVGAQDCNHDQICQLDARNGNKTCRKKIGETCNAPAECGSLNCTSHRCVSKAGQECQNASQCGLSEACVAPMSSGPKLCMLENDAYCGHDRQCASLWCSQTQCRASTGHCTNNADCPSDFECKANVCRVRLGSYCQPSADLCEPLAAQCRVTGIGQSGAVCKTKSPPAPPGMCVLCKSQHGTCMNTIPCVLPPQWPQVWRNLHAVHVLNKPGLEARVADDLLDRLRTNRNDLMRRVLSPNP
ncbi:MAG: hypothetical protein KC620_15175 [Myxococcales bacterium]|nr:hypothetical protein [Myxococcales bacterium]